jgi:hypothetical protein
MKHANPIVALAIWLLGAVAVLAQPAAEKILPLDAQIAEDGRAITLSWFDATPPRVGSVTVKRRLYGQIGGESWRSIATGLGPVMRYTDDTIKPGVAYEYQVLRTARDIVDVGYWLAGTDLPARSQRGRAYVIVDETIVSEIMPRLERFERDLIGDGWQIQRHLALRGDDRFPIQNLKAGLKIKSWLHERYREDPFAQHAVVLVGHVPIVRSGRANPDGHSPTAHPTDLFYADVDGRWSATRDGRVLDNRLPGNFAEMQVGRVDFSPVNGGDIHREIHLLRAYFDKNHHWRMGYLGDLREAYGESSHLTVELFGLRNIVGPTAITTGGHHDAGEEKPWLWGVDFGDSDGYQYAGNYANKSVFAINFGSGKQKFGSSFNPMIALLAQPFYTLSVGWGARPAWWLHHMALGGSIGDVHIRTVNNGEFEKPYQESMDYFPTGGYLMRNPVWVNLMGDPTLRAFPLAPPPVVTILQRADETRLTWEASPDPDVLGYRIYRATAESTDFMAIDDGRLITALQFMDRTPVENARYMVRAYGLKNVYAGSFYTFSQGVQIPAGFDETQIPDIAITTSGNQPVRLPESFNQVTEGKIHAIVEGPAKGRLTHDGTSWLYTPPDVFPGTERLRFSVSGGGPTQLGVLRISVEN